MTSDATKAAFDINSEPDAVRKRYGRNMLGQSCLMARRLIEAGVRCAFVNHIDWDTHYNNFHVLKNELLPKLDAAMSSLLTDLDERGMLDSTMVLVTGEFGRTPLALIRMQAEITGVRVVLLLWQAVGFKEGELLEPPMNVRNDRQPPLTARPT